MIGLKIFNVIIFLTTGILNLASDKISKFSYAIIWIVLMVYLIVYCFCTG
jgi:hypothetical protein